MSGRSRKSIQRKQVYAEDAAFAVQRSNMVSFAASDSQAWRSGEPCLHTFLCEVKSTLIRYARYVETVVAKNFVVLGAAFTHFDHHLQLRTIEVHYARQQGRLSAPFQSPWTQPQQIPQVPLSRRWIFSHLPRQFSHLYRGR